MGVLIVMDDFGIGYLLLSYLSLFLFDKIKIDKVFIQNLGKDFGIDVIVVFIIGLGCFFDVMIIVEGVEMEDQVILLRVVGCDLVQGYFYGKLDDVVVYEMVVQFWVGWLLGSMIKGQQILFFVYLVSVVELDVKESFVELEIIELVDQ